MQHHIIKSLAVLALGAMLMATCTKTNVSEETIVGNWHLQDNSTAPTVDVKIAWPREFPFTATVTIKVWRDYTDSVYDKDKGRRVDPFALITDFSI